METRVNSVSALRCEAERIFWIGRYARQVQGRWCSHTSRKYYWTVLHFTEQLKTATRLLSQRLCHICWQISRSTLQFINNSDLTSQLMCSRFAFNQLFMYQLPGTMANDDKFFVNALQNCNYTNANSTALRTFDLRHVLAILSPV